ncbi:hypothetical protein PV10_03552 [Exophiala mesophila]|uniref:Putative transcription factor kapC n=1 Tax=Exophiala mesophila TaxID=212818 RepID=A0A0D1X2H4_EXOME|nr:uncharacterized protein PV10_03552 [Exophiala mesophila]KIV95965.1 hypothetical protein PV10_03552 [Exophiala mesophila]
MRPKATYVPLEPQPSLQDVFGTTESRIIFDDCTRASESTFSDLESDSKRPRYGHSRHDVTDLEISQPERIRFEFINGPSFSYKYQQLDAEQLQHDVLAAADSSEALAYRQMRRRAQNRASQRAFRDRKEKYIRHLKQQIQILSQQHDTLMESATRQTALVTTLGRRLIELETRLRETRKRQQEKTDGPGDDDAIPLFDLQFPAEFDAFTLFSAIENKGEVINGPEIDVHGLVSCPNDPHLPLMSYSGELW